MAWVTKSSEEHYDPAPPPREYSREEKAANWWHYHKIALLVGLIVVLIAGWMIYDVVSQVKPDLEVGYVGASGLPDETVQALQEALAPYCIDRNGDGQVVVQISQYNVSFGSESQDSDPYNQMAGMTKLSAALEEGSGTYLFLLSDPANFEEQTEALQYPDGTLPTESETGNWQQMVYRWGDCPALTALDLGSYTLLEETGSTQQSNQELLAPLYLGCRGNWTGEDSDSYTLSNSVWQLLTEGATTPTAEV